MAYYAALVSVVQLLDDILLHNRYPKLALAKRTILKPLHEKFSILENSLREYSSKGSKANDRVEGRIRDVAYQVQDVIEWEISNQILVSRGEAQATESIFLQSTPRAGAYKQTRPLEVKKSSSHKFFLDFKALVCRQKRRPEYVGYLRTVLQDIDSVVQELMAIKEEDVSEELKLNHDPVDIDAFERAPVVGGNTMVGFNADLTAIKERLCGPSTQLQVIPIVGMGGIGKTTLARSTFDDDLVAYHFHLRVWVTVSQDYQLNQVLRSIESSLDLEIDGTPLEERIRKHLIGRRYLIVMDDVWNTEVWDDVKQLFPDDHRNGSRIMITTRLVNVAEYTATSNIFHEMRVLDDDESWNLLEREVFAQEKCPSELEYVGKNIARQCHGLPLAIIVVAGILSDDVRTRDSWENIARNVRAILRESTDETLKGILSLSYNHLSHQLKACFLYMASFPEDYEIDISNLIFLWIAEGFLKSENESKSLEELGEECLNDLVKRNLVMMKKGSYGELKFCVLHDILRDFCKQRALHECFCHDVMSEDNYRGFTPTGVESTVRRINMNCKRICLASPRDMGEHKLVRSILVFGEPASLGTELNRNRLLRVLDFAMEKPTINILSRMFHLKYLKLYVNFGFRPFPCTWMPMLVNLQTIIFTLSLDTTAIIPIWKMAQLRHVIIFDHFWLPRVCRFVGHICLHKLEYLQTLMTVQDFKITDEVIQMIPNLRNLRLRFDEIEDRHCLHNLVRFRHLEKLQIKHQCHDFCTAHEGFPRSFALPSNLRELHLDRIKLSGEVLKVIGALPNLQVLKLKSIYIDGKVWFVTEEEFPRLKFLSMERLPDLEYLKPEGSSLFPCLEILKITDCADLKEIPLEIGDIPTLEVIDIRGRSRCKCSVIQIRKEQKQLGNEVLQVHIPREWRLRKIRKE